MVNEVHRVLRTDEALYLIRAANNLRKATSLIEGSKLPSRGETPGPLGKIMLSLDAYMARVNLNDIDSAKELDDDKHEAHIPLGLPGMYKAVVVDEPPYNGPRISVENDGKHTGVAVRAEFGGGS